MCHHANFCANLLRRYGHFSIFQMATLIILDTLVIDLFLRTVYQYSDLSSSLIRVVDISVNLMTDIVRA